MAELKEITDLSDIKILVNTFYNSVREDDLLADIFQEKIQDNWSVHLEKMYRFWQTVLLGEHSYYGSPFAPHSTLAIEKKHFDRWKLLFEQAVNKHFIGKKAEEAIWRAKKMAEMFQMKINHYNKKSLKPLL